jgi:hypothetical protein
MPQMNAMTPEQRKAEAIKIATDLIDVLSKPMPTQESNEMDLKDYSLESIVAGRPDVAALQSKANQLEALQTKVNEFEAREAARLKAEAIESEIAASGVDKARVTASVRKSLEALESVDRVAFLADLASFSAKPAIKTETPITSEKPATESVGDSLESVIANITGISAKK